MSLTKIQFDATKGMFNWSVTFKRGNHKFTIPFYTVDDSKPDVKRVMSTLFVKQLAVKLGYKGFCNFFNLDSNDPASYKHYVVSKQQVKMFQKFLGHDFNKVKQEVAFWAS